MTLASLIPERGSDMEFRRFCQGETMAELGKVPRGTVSEQSMQRGEMLMEPLLIGMDGLLRYAKAYKARFESPLCDDGVLGPAWLKAAKGLRYLLNGDGAVAMERGYSTDSKDNGVIEAIFWHALAAAGYQESDL